MASGHDFHLLGPFPGSQTCLLPRDPEECGTALLFHEMGGPDRKALWLDPRAGWGEGLCPAVRSPGKVSLEHGAWVLSYPAYPRSAGKPQGCYEGGSRTGVEGGAMIVLLVVAFLPFGRYDRNIHCAQTLF